MAAFLSFTALPQLLDLLKALPINATAVVSLVALALATLYHLTKPKLPYPPGSSLLSLLRILGQPHPARALHENTRRFGPISSFGLGRKRIVVIGNYKVANDLMERKSALTSDRPECVMAGEYMSGGMRISLTPYGDRWRRLRKMVHHGLQPNAAKSYEPLQEAASRRAILGIIREPHEFRHHIQNYAASFIMQVTYGKDPETTNWFDPEVAMIHSLVSRVMAEAKPEKRLVNTFPFLKYFPGQWKGDGRRYHQEELAFFQQQMDGVRELIKNGEDPNCFGKYVIEHQADFGLNDAEAAYIAGTMFEAGSDTTNSVVSSAILAMTAYPEVTLKAQEELDRVVGRDRLPTFTDEQDLPYLQAFIKEVHRWRPAVPTGAGHATTEDIVYENYLIPKGSLIVGNQWGISRDPGVFDDVEAFKPDRWFVDGNTAGALRKDINHVS